MGVGEHEPKPVQNNTLCTIMAVFVGVGKGTVDLWVVGYRGCIDLKLKWEGLR